MPQFSDGQKISEALVWDRLIQSGPASYVIWKDGTQTKAECLLKGGTDYTTGTDATVMQAAIDALTTGTILVKKATYSLTAGLSITSKEIEIVCEAGTIFQATAAIDMLTFQTVNASSVDAGIKNGVFDMNNIATKGIHVKDCWFVEMKNIEIENVPANGIGVHIDSTAGCYQNRFFGRINGISNATGSIGIKTERTAGTATPNANEFSCRLQDLDYGFKILHGSQQLFHKCDATLNNYGYDISSYGNVSIDSYEESNTTKGYIVRTGGSILIFGGETEKTECEGTGSIIHIPVGSGAGNASINLRSRTANPTPSIVFSEEGNVGARLVFNSGLLKFLDPDLNKQTIQMLVSGSSGAIRILRSVDEYELGSLEAGSSQNRPVLKFWDVTANAYKYAYIDNGAWVIANAPPT